MPADSPVDPSQLLAPWWGANGVRDERLEFRVWIQVTSCFILPARSVRVR